MKALLLVAALAASQCNTPQPTPVPEPQPEPVEPVPSGASCKDACANFDRLGCEEALMTHDGATCVEVCQNAQEGSAPLDLGCIVRASSCASARRCE